ncbi:winged helix-turn-helix transcriptional regulator [Paenibacillus harenae]|uniref:winged helix-turn-helix transcriptional regulator n=1 Tax=Paenibacillus harenae TaxID=306543 RepID=UPI002792A46C|nr:helix-turn-helix domain-containing protein [Paenibacillus harenae]MDQ0061388.1 DNA-binding HxlR family transcriptional regulator [Paenibacillus harenae]
MEPQPKRRYIIPAEATIEVIGGKWKTLILCHLSYGPKRSSELKKAMPDITQKMLTQQLRELEDDGIIFRTVFNQVPPKVVYEMTEIGESLQPILDQMCEWGEKFIQGKFYQNS